LHKNRENEYKSLKSAIVIDTSTLHRYQHSTQIATYTIDSKITVTGLWRCISPAGVLGISEQTDNPITWSGITW